MLTLVNSIYFRTLKAIFYKLSSPKRSFQKYNFDIYIFLLAETFISSTNYTLIFHLGMNQNSLLYLNNNLITLRAWNAYALV